MALRKLTNYDAMSREELIALLQDRDTDIDTIIEVIKKLLALFGMLNEEGIVDPRFFTGEKNVVTSTLSSLTALSLDMSTAKTLGMFRAGKEAAERVHEKTRFVEELLIPIVQKFNI